MSKEENISPRYTYWEQPLNIEISKPVWSQIFKNCFKTVKNNDLIWLQYRILNRIVGTKDYLFKIKRTNDRKCSFCNKEFETIMHLFVSCEQVQNFWLELEKDILLNLDIKLGTTPYEIILGQTMIGSLAHIQNFVYLTAKAYIFKRSKLKGKLSLRDYFCYIKNIYEEQEYVSKLEFKHAQFVKTWGNLQWLFL